MQQLQEDVTCSICLDVLDDPVSIECSHNFCRGCLMAHWRGVSAWGPRCPECRAPCSRDRMTPDTRLRALVEKITEPLREEMEPVRPDRLNQGKGAQDLTGPRQGPGAQREPGRPVQLVRLDDKGSLILDEEALSRCLEQGGVGDAPVCLVSIIGEQRRGKSFLMNCLLRRLQSPEAVDASWMVREDEALGGFECCNGTATVTRGVWMWDQPLWVQAQGRRVAVFLVDTEGSLDLQRRMETSIKLSVFSILLSSYWIFNISSTFKQTEADYLEMFIQVAKEVGGTCNLAPIQRLDLLVRDWQLSGAYGADAGQEYLVEITQDLEVSAEQPLVLEALRASGTRCYLLPHPGTQFTRSRAGTPDDIDEDFRQCLCEYVTSVVRSAGTHVRTDRAGQVLTGAQLAARIKMAEAFAVMRQELNRRAVEATRREYDQFVQELDRDHQSMSSCLRVKPAKMKQLLEGKRQELLELCRGELRGEDPQKQVALEELKKELDKQMAEFLPRYEQRFKMAAMIEEENRKAVEASRMEYEQFVQQLDRDHQSMHRCLRVNPLKMQRHLEGKRQELLEHCRGELLGEDPQKQVALEELEQELDKQMDEFLAAYEQRFKMAEMREKANRGAVEAARREYGLFVKQLDRGHQSMSSCLRVKPLEMKRHQEGKRQELLERCRGELRGEDPQKQAALEELKQELDRQMDQFLLAYGQRFKMAAMEANKKAVEVAMKGYEHFLQKLDHDHQSMNHCLSVKPAEMHQRLEGKRQELLECCWRELLGEDLQKQAALKELKQGLANQMAQFLMAYRERFKKKTYIWWGVRIVEGAVVVAGGSVGGRIGLSVAAAMVAGAERFMGLDR
ncbi:RING finger protein 112-like isoform X2 [Chrysemys picta bellii]|uniref:RING finger protein 112-like isoform X2 n=1 Tax=Chrysemys picta bellii TaxID=8478 RepID=UPI0032B1B132